VSAAEKVAAGGLDPLRPWEGRVAEAVGAVITYWGFKHNHGRIWSFLYLRGQPYCAADIQELLGLSKGAVSMLLRELEQWEVLQRVQVADRAADHFVANPDFMPMIGRVLGNREVVLFAKVRSEIEAAEEAAALDRRAPPGALERLRRMRSLARFMEDLIQVLMSTARLDLQTALTLITKLKRGRRS
jgi:DNA-binding transcriptional regulator GbsR (MarR family)